VNPTSLYESDFHAWLLYQADALRAQNIAQLDFANLIEEIETMGRSEKRSLKSRLTVLLMHLIKWQCQPHYRSRSWMLTINHQRQALRDSIDDSPSLKPFLASFIDSAWERAKRDVEIETGIESIHFPPSCPWQVDQFMSDHFWPQTEQKQDHSL